MAKKKKQKIKVFTAFSGYDSQMMAMKRLCRMYPDQLECELVGWSEIDIPAIKSHNAVFPESADKNLGDISKIDWSTVEDFDLFTYSSPCLPADQKILTKDGYKPIIDVQVGDVVFTKGCTWEKVAKKFDNGEHPTCTIKSLLAEPIRCTLNHKFWVRKLEGEPQFVEAKDLTMYDHLCIPIELKKDYLNYTKDTPYCALVQDKYIWFPILGIEMTGKIEHVYNIEVENDHSYIVNGCISKNCQDFSRAGLQKGGEAGSGTRSSLLWECERTIREKRPKFCLLENVKALYSDKKFHPLLMRWKKTVDDYGYHSYIKVINAADMDVPQGRERVFMVSVRNDVIEEVFHGKDYRFPADMPRKRKIEDFLLPPEQVPEEYYLKAAHLPKFLNLLTHAGDDFDNNLTDAQKAAITSANVALTTDQPEDIPQDTSVNNGLAGYVPKKSQNSLF